MCGIVAVLRRPSRRPVPDAGSLLRELESAGADLGVDATTEALRAVAEAVERVDAALHGVPGVSALLADLTVADAIDGAAGRIEDEVAAIEHALDAVGVDLPAAELEERNAAIVAARDALWALRRDRVRSARSIADLAGAHPTPSSVEAFTSIQVGLSAIDRLEVRGRDSAGLHVLVTGHGLDSHAPDVVALLDGRTDDVRYPSGSVRCAGAAMTFVYKAAAEIGELGDNTAALRAAIRDDELLHRAVAADGARAIVLGHTRWASVGVIAEANAHPLVQEEEHPGEGPYVAAALNGDVDNYADLVAEGGLCLPPEVTTDAKVIPVLTSRRIASGQEPPEAFRATVASLEGSLAIVALCGERPDELLLSLRGSGQALYIGVADDEFVVASEPYGLVEETRRYLRMDGETPANPANPVASRGQVVVLDGAHAGCIEGIRRTAFDGTALPLRDDELSAAEITTRDVDRGAAPHYLLKEITESPTSFRKTLRGKIVERGGHLSVDLGDDSLPARLRDELRAGHVRRVIATGMGTAGVAARSLARALGDLTSGAIEAEAIAATELSGFAMRDDMRDTLVIAISQSGTTTDTNRTVDIARERGAIVVSIVNRRNSDLVDKSDGVLFTSDGRDVEMSVASTKAFYAQIAAGFLLAIAIAELLPAPPPAAQVSALLAGLRELPVAMARVVAQGRPALAAAAQRHAPVHRDWAVVGNGTNRIAAHELRIKLSELCYKSISSDVTEEKKHIDLSAEPLVLVCAAGLTGSNCDDVAKEVEIYRAHRGTPIVFATEGESRFRAAVDVVEVPPAHPALAFVLAVVAGHLFGYEAALAIDASARPLREARAAVEEALRVAAHDPDTGFARARETVDGPSHRFFEGLTAGGYNGSLEPGTAVRLASLLRYATGIVPLDAYQLEHGKVGTPSVVLHDLVGALTDAIGQLTRPVDAIKHQAKTVTVGISRADETLLRVPLVKEVVASGAPRDSLSYRVLRTLVDLDRAVAQVTGYTRYRIEGDAATEDATIYVVDQGGVATGLTSRTERDPRLRGIKHRAAFEREVTVARGASDGRTLVVVPEVKGAQATGITLLHVAFHDHLPPEEARAVLEGYRGRYDALRDAVLETETHFDDALLGEVPLVELLTVPVHVMAERWRARS